MTELRQLFEATVARQTLGSIPGVERIGFGLKEQGGIVLPEYVFRVYVRRKKPLAELHPQEIIPPEVDGIKTDVLVLFDTELACTPTVAPGMRITRELPNYPEGYGTLGCVVRKASHTYILTNSHVVIPDTSFSISNDVYQPEPCIFLEIHCNKPVATVVSELAPWTMRAVSTFDGKQFWIDGAIVQIRDGVVPSNVIEGIGAINAQIRDLASEPGMPGTTSNSTRPVATITLHKRGAVTRVTHGTVIEFSHEQVLPDNPTGPPLVIWELVISPTVGEPYSKTFRISTEESRSISAILNAFAGQPVTATLLNPGDPNDRRIHFEGTVFSLRGDSGSLCVDDARRPCGVLFAGRGVNVRVDGEAESIFIPSGRAVASYIRPLLLSLDLNPADAIVVASLPAAGTMAVGPGDALVPVGDTTRDLAQELARLRSALETTPRGRRISDLVREHKREIIDLVNHRKRVTVAWQRGKGPAFLATFLNAVRSGDGSLPTMVAGRSLAELLDKMLAALWQEGSPHLRQAIEREGGLISRIVGRCETIVDLFAELEQESSAGEQAQP